MIVFCKNKLQGIPQKTYLSKIGMAVTKGNQFWQLRSKHGRDKLFSSPELLWESACEYFQWCVENPLLESQIVKGNRTETVETPLKDKNGKVQKSKSKTTIPYDIATLPKMRPFTMHGLCIYLGVSTNYFRNFEDNNKNSDDFMAVITRIKEVIYNQKFEGAASGFFNANIIARDLGLSDKQEVASDVKNSVGDISDDALAKIEKILYPD